MNGGALEAAREAQSRTVLNELAILLNAGELVDTLFHRLPALLAPVIQFDYIGLLVAAAEPETLRMVGSEPEIVRPAGSFVSFQAAQVDKVLATGESVTQFRPQHLEGESSAAFRAAGIQRVLTVLLQQGSETVGMFTLGRRDKARFTADELTFIDLVTTMLRQAVGNQYRLARSQAEAARSRLLNQLAILLNSGEPVEEIFARIVQQLGSAIPFDALSLLVHEHDGILHPVGDHHGPALPAGARLDLADWGLDHRRMRQGRVVRYGADDAPGDLPARLRKASILEAATAVMAENGEFLGVVNVGRSERHPFTDQEAEFLALVGTLLGQVLANRLRLERKSQEAEEQRLIAGAAAVAARDNDPSLIIGGLIEPLARLVPDPYVAYAYIKGDRLLWVHRWIEREVDPLSLRAIAEGQVAVADISECFGSEHAVHELGIHAGTSTLAHSGGRPTGLLAIASRRPGYTFGPRELRLFRLLAQIIGPAMENGRAAQETETQRTLYELALSSLTDAVILIDHDLRGTYANSLGRRIIDALSPAASLVDILDVLPPDASGVLRRALVADKRGQGRAPLTIDGTTIWFDFEILPLKHPAYRFIVVATDVTSSLERQREDERHRSVVAEAAAHVERERALYNFALNSLSEAVVLLDHDFKTVFANPKGAAVVDLIDPERRLRTPEDVLPRLPRVGRDALQRASQHRERSSGRTAILVDGERRWLDFEFIPLEHPNLALLAVASDVTDAVERDAERERHREQIEHASRLAALGELIGGVAHELNNPLTAILGFTEMMVSAPEAAPLAGDLAIVRKEALRARNIVRDLLFIARPGPVDRAEVDVRDVVAHVERLRRGAWTQQGIDVAIDTASPGLRVWGNENQLTQVILNLVTNAEQALAGTTGPAITLRALLSGDSVVVEVADNGPGMDDATQARIFEPFFTTRPGVGTGLGLSLSYSMVRSHEGVLDIESAPGAGARFRLTLPAHRRADPSAGGDRAPQTAASLRVLVIDDEPSLRRVCQRILESLAHDCDTAANVAEALAAVESANYDLVLCDYRLATQTADDVVEGFIRRRPELLPRTVICTGATTDAGVVDLVARHSLRLIAKPYGLAEISALVAAIPSPAARSVR